MKIMAREVGKAEKAPVSASLLQLTGVSHLFFVAWIVWNSTALWRDQLGVIGIILSILVALDLAVSASLMSFVLARVVMDLHAIRWNTDGYTVERDKEDMRLLSRAIDRLSDNIDRIVNGDHVEATDETEPEDPQEDYNPDDFPYDEYE